MRLVATKEEAHASDGVGNVIDSNAYGPEAGQAAYDELHVPCPAHTTEKRLMAKIDLHLLPFLCILYLLAFLDRINVGNARSFRLQEDLGLDGVKYNSEHTPRTPYSHVRDCVVVSIQLGRNGLPAAVRDIKRPPVTHRS